MNTFDDRRQRLEAEPVGDVERDAVDPRHALLLGSCAPSRTKVNAPTAGDRDQRRQLEPEVAGREAVQAEAGGGVQPRPPPGGRASATPARRPARPAARTRLSRRSSSHARTFARSSGLRRSRTRKTSATTSATTVAEREQPARDVLA